MGPLYLMEKMRMRVSEGVSEGVRVTVSMRMTVSEGDSEGECNSETDVTVIEGE